MLDRSTGASPTVAMIASGRSPSAEPLQRKKGVVVRIGRREQHARRRPVSGVAPPAARKRERAPTGRQTGVFNAQAFLGSGGIARTIVQYGQGDAIFRQGDRPDHVLYIQKGGVQLSVISKAGRQAVVAMLAPGEFFGEGCLAGQAVRMGSATASVDSTILRVDKDQMKRLLREQHALSDRFIAHMLARNIRIEQDLIDQLFNSSERRLARTLLLLARYGELDKPARTIPAVSRETLADMVGTTRSRVNFFMKKFQRLGFIDYKAGLQVNNSLLTVVLQD